MFQSHLIDVPEFRKFRFQEVFDLNLFCLTGAVIVGTNGLGGLGLGWGWGIGGNDLVQGPDVGGFGIETLDTGRINASIRMIVRRRFGELILHRAAPRISPF